MNCNYNNYMNIALGFDKNFLPHAATTIKSIIANNKNTHINFFLMINHSINIIDRFLLKLLIGKTNNVKFFNMSKKFDNLFQGFWSTAMYYPILLPSLCNDKRILFLDADTVILGSLIPFYNTNLDGYYCAAVKDYGLDIQMKKGKTKLKINKKGHFMTISDFMHNKLKFTESELQNYFNSGVLLLNLEKIRQDKIENKMIDYVKNRDLMFPDQDCLNVFFKNKTKLMPYKYNYQVISNYCIELFDENDVKNYKEYINRNKNPLIIHYLNKPFRNLNVLFGDKYYYYRNKTFWRFTIDKNIKKRLIRLKLSPKGCYLSLLGNKIFDNNNLLQTGDLINA